VHFNSIRQLQRPGLLLTQGSVVIAFGSLGDKDPYHGWVLAYRTSDFALTGLLCTTPNGARGGIWQAGQGPVFDSKGHISVGTGNGDSDKGGSRYLGRQKRGRKFLQLTFSATGLTDGLVHALTISPDPGAQSLATIPMMILSLRASIVARPESLAAAGRMVHLSTDRMDRLEVKEQFHKFLRRPFNPRSRMAASSAGPGARRRSRHIHGRRWFGMAAQGVFVYVWERTMFSCFHQYSPEVNAIRIQDVLLISLRTGFY
jgi:hypothetical protein